MRQCCILDLDSTLIRSYDSDEVDKLKSTGIFSESTHLGILDQFYSFEIHDINDRGDVQRQHTVGIKRPHLDKFLNYLHYRCEVVGVWTAGTYRYGHGVVDCIFPGYTPHVVYTRNDCVGPMRSLEKPLSKMIQEIPGLSSYMSLENTFIIDDRTCSMFPNRDNGILIPVYNPDPSIKDVLSDDRALLDIMTWLERPDVRYCKDIRDLPKDTIFETPPTQILKPQEKSPR